MTLFVGPTVQVILNNSGLGVGQSEDIGHIPNLSALSVNAQHR